MNADNIHTPQVSVIIPVWNPGPGVSRCLESLRGQTLEDIEMIFVDDCGTDGAMDVVRAAAKEDPRIRIITNVENMGAGVSRNVAIELSHGEYISFVDADDYVDVDFLEILYRKGMAENLDIIKGIITYESEDGAIVEQVYRQNDEIRKGIEENKPLFYLFSYEFSSAIYHSRLFVKSDVRFGLTSNGEDATFLLKACHVARSFGMDNHPAYHYLFRGTSGSNAKTKAKLDNRISSLRDRAEYLVNHVVPNPYAGLYLKRKIKDYLPLQKHVSRIVGMEKAASQFLVDLREIASNYLNIEAVLDKDLTIIALIKYGENLADRPYHGPWEVSQPEDYADVVVRCVDFLQSHPKYYKELPTLIFNANGFVKRMESDGISKEKIEAYEKQIRVLWRKPLIMWMLFKNKLRRVLAKLKKKCFDKK